MKKNIPVHIAENCAEDILIADAALDVPCSNIAAKNENNAISNGSKCPNQAIKTPVNPFPPNKVALND